MLGWIQFIQGLPPWLVPIAVTVVVVLVVFYAVRCIVRAWPTLKLFVLTVNAITGLPEFMDRTDSSIATMRRQIENDHKTNLRDDITDAQKTAKRVERGVRGLHKKVDERFASVQQQIDELHHADADIRADFEKTQPTRTKETP